MDTLLVNLVLMGYIERDLSALVEYCETVSEATGVPIPPNYPVVGRDAFRTATGVHAAAVIKAFRKQDQVLVDAVYSAVPASDGRARAGRSRSGRCPAVRTCCSGWRSAGWRSRDAQVDAVFARAKASASVLTEAEILERARTATRERAA